MSLLPLLLLGVILTSAVPLFATPPPTTESDPAEPADPRRVSLIVLDGTNRDPIVGAVVRCTAALSPDVTDQKGQCTLRFKQPVREIQVHITCIGYKPIRRSLAVTPGKPITLRMQEDIRQFSEILVSGQQRRTNKLQQTARITSEALEKGGATSLAKMLETIPGVSSISSGSTVAKPVIQGMHSSRILLMNNGVRLESQSWGADHAPEIDYTGASMVEVVKGAECVRYGFGAMGGVVLLNEAPLPYGNDKLQVHGKANLGYDTNARGGSGSGSLELGYRNVGLRLHGMYTKGGDYRTAEYILNNTGYNTISLSGVLGYKSRRIEVDLSSSLYYQRSGIYYASKISDLDQLIKRFEYGRPDPSTLHPFSYDIKPPFQQSQHFTLKGEFKWNINDHHKLTLTASFQENLRQEFENRKKVEWSWVPMQDLILKTYKVDAQWNAKWKLWNMSTDVGTANTYQTNYNYPGTKQPAFVPNFAALTMGGYVLHRAQFDRLQCALGMRYDFRVMSVNGYTSLSNYTYYDDGSYWVVGNSKLESERGYKSVLGGRYRDTWFSIEPSLFYQRINSYIYDHIGTGKDRFHNHPSGKYPKFIYDQDDVQLYGGDLEATMTPLKGLTVVGKAEWMFARNITRGDWLPFMPSDRYGLTGTYERSLGAKEKYHASLSLSGLYVTKQRRFDPDKDLVSDSPDPYFLLGGTAEFAIRLPQRREVRFMIVGENILNNLYKEYTDRFRYYAHERGVNVSLRTLIKF